MKTFSPSPHHVNPHTGRNEAPQCIIRNFGYGSDRNGLIIQLNFHRSVIDVKNSCGFEWAGVYENQPLRAVVQAEEPGDWYAPGHPQPKPLARALDNMPFNFGFSGGGAVYLIATWIYMPLRRATLTFTVQMMIGKHLIPFSQGRHPIDQYGRLIFTHTF